MNKKKLGIITMFNSPNYGACLQSFALWKYLNNQGYDCEIINLAHPRDSDFIASKKYKRLTYNDESFVQCLKDDIKNFIKAKIKKIVKKLFDIPKSLFDKELKQRSWKFDVFNAQIKLSKRYRSVDELYKNPPAYDVYITGSDQVWNPEHLYMSNIPIEPYFLTFVNNGGRKMSYASSIGVTSLSSEVKAKYKQRLASYTHISVREEQGKKLLEEITNQNVEVVLDPTFLLNISDYQSIAIKPQTNKKYVFCFTLSGRMTAALRDYAKKIADELGVELVVINQHLQKKISTDYTYVVNAGIEEFLGWIENAEMVFTDSFHGTVFCAMLSKNFFAYISDNRRGSRIINLLQKFDLLEHLLDNTLVLSANELTSHQLNRSELNEKIAKEQQKSQDFLLSMIEK